jgi:bifunctional non-homologous end joining protein LigD
VAGLVNVLLERLGIAGYPKTSGSSGIHIYVPLDPVYSYRRVRAFVEAVGRMISAADPDAATLEWDIPKRGARIFIDPNQNVGGKTTASVYAVRPVAGAQASTPILWDELGTVRPGDFTIATIWNRLSKYGDLFAPVLAGGRRIDDAVTALGGGAG